MINIQRGVLCSILLYRLRESKFRRDLSRFHDLSKSCSYSFFLERANYKIREHKNITP